MSAIPDKALFSELGAELCPCESGKTRARCNPSHTPGVPLPGSRWVMAKDGNFVRLARRLDGTSVLQIMTAAMRPAQA